MVVVVVVVFVVMVVVVVAVVEVVVVVAAAAAAVGGGGGVEVGVGVDYYYYYCISLLHVAKKHPSSHATTTTRTLTTHHQFDDYYCSCCYCYCYWCAPAPSLQRCYWERGQTASLKPQAPRSSTCFYLPCSSFRLSIRPSVSRSLHERGRLEAHSQRGKLEERGNTLFSPTVPESGEQTYQVVQETQVTAHDMVPARSRQCVSRFQRA